MFAELNRRLQTLCAVLAASVCLQCSLSGQVYNPANGHYYQYVSVPGGLDWFAAESAANALSHEGIAGHLVTLTSAQENSFVFDNFGSNMAWLGGFQPPGSFEPAGGWQWVTRETWDFTSWSSPGEPNDLSGIEDGLVYVGGPDWWDAARTSLAAGYVVEFSRGTEAAWAKSDGGDFHTASNWVSEVVPSPFDSAIFDLDSEYTVTAESDIAINSLVLRTDDVTLSLGSNTLELGGTQGQVLRVADANGDTGSLRITSGTVVTRGLGVASTDGSQGATGLFEIDGPAARVEVVGPYIENQVGGGGNNHGQVRVRNGGELVVSEDIYLGFYGGQGMLSVAGQGSAVEVSWFLVVGNGGFGEHSLGEMLIEDRATVTSDQRLIVGLSDGTPGAAQGSVVVSSGGVLTSARGISESGSSALVGPSAGSVGTVKITGTGSKWIQDGNLNIGWLGTGELRIEDGGRVESARGQLGREGTGIGSAKVTDIGSTWDIDEDLSIGGTEAVQGGQGLLEVSAGGLVDVGTILRVWESGVVDVTNGGTIEVGEVSSTTPAGTLRVGDDGRLQGNGVVKGNVHVKGLGLVGPPPAARATVAPGNGGTATGRLTVNGNYVQEGIASLEIDLAGGLPATQYDQLFITGQASLNGGRLSVSLAGGFSPVAGDMFNILDWGSVSGTFTNISLPPIGGGLAWNTSQLYTTGTLSVGPTPQIIARWTFEAGKPGNPVSANGTTLSGVSPATGSGAASGFHTSAATVWDNPAGNGSTESMSSNNWSVGNYYQFQISTIDLENITLNFEQISSSSGPRDFQLQYSTDGTLFTDFGAPYAVRTNATPAWSASTPSGIDSFGFDLSSISAINDLAAVFFRLTVDSNISSSGGTIGTGGTSRLDNVTFWGTQILGLAGDFDGDGDVDGRDFLAWQRDPSVGDLADWQANYGNSSLDAAVSVPEPNSLLALASFLVLLVYYYRPSQLLLHAICFHWR